MTSIDRVQTVARRARIDHACVWSLALAVAFSHSVVPQDIFNPFVLVTTQSGRLRSHEVRAQYGPRAATERMPAICRLWRRIAMSPRVDHSVHFVSFPSSMSNAYVPCRNSRISINQNACVGGLPFINYYPFLDTSLSAYYLVKIPIGYLNAATMDQLINNI